MKIINMGVTWKSTGIVDIQVQQSLSKLLNKTQLNLIGELSLEGLDIDWHLAEYDYPALPIGNDQPTYAYAA
tara:strand:+ start:1375 stop:1590 length:216 start_codon:yes stop_codon:yes gene_type:complete